MDKIDEILDELFLQVLIAHSKSEGKRLYYLARDKAKIQILAEAGKMAEKCIRFNYAQMGQFMWILEQSKETQEAIKRVFAILNGLLEQNIHDKFSGKEK